MPALPALPAAVVRCALPLLLAGCVAFFAVGCQRSPATPAAKATGEKTDPANDVAEDTPKVIRTVVVGLDEWSLVVRVQGSLFADEHAVVGTRVAGRVSRVPVDLGTIVRRGQELSFLDSEEFDLHVRFAEAQLTQARAKLGLKPGDDEEKLDRLKAPPVAQERALLDEAKVNHDRAKQLFRQSAMTAEELQQKEALERVAEARYNSSLNSVEEQIALLGIRRTELALALQTQADAVARAPFDGIVQERHVAPGVFVQVGDQIVTLVRTNPLRFRTGVPEREALHVAIGQEMHLSFAGDDKPVVARVSRISPTLDLSSRALVIEADVPNPVGRLRTGLFAEAEIVIDPDAKTLVVPATAVTEFAGVEKVWLVKEGEAKEQTIRTGRRDEKRLEIIAGLSAGDVVIADGRQGHIGKVTVSPEEPAAEAESTPTPETIPVTAEKSPLDRHEPGHSGSGPSGN